MNRPRRSLHAPHLVTALVVAALALSLCAPAEAGRTKRRPRPRAAATAVVPAPAAPGMVVGIDPETGRLGMPTAAQMLELSAAERTGLLRTSDGLTEVVLPDGSVMVDLQGRFMTYAVVRLDALGGRAFTWADDAPALWRALAAPAPAPALEER
jgi:hypothetical protein